METNLLTSEWFKEKGKKFEKINIEATALYNNFESKFEPSKLADLSDEDLLNTLFIGGKADNMCHELEYLKDNQMFGSIKNGTSFKFPLFKSNKGIWMSGSSNNQVQLSLSEAITKGTAVRDALVKGANIIKDSLPLNTVENYLALYNSLRTEIPEIIDSMWVIKYYHMIFPDLIPTFYSKKWQLNVLSALKINPSKNAFGRLGQINLFVRKCEISNVVFAHVFYDYKNNYHRNHEVVKEDDKLEVVTEERLKCGQNIILYGVPGSGKSWTIKHEYCDDDDKMERIVFHPDYTYSDFVGQILPKVNEDSTISYEFTPGPFTNIVKKAYLNPEKEYFLIIEEVNRGNAPAIFGDIFQLLDRNKDGSSDYKITNDDVAKIVYGNKNKKVFIPSNMSIICTMNTSDQNVFTLDTAFQRRWNMKLIKNKFRDEKAEKTFAETKILDTDVTWERFFTSINKIILSKNIRMTSSEDKRLGTHFIGVEDLKYIEGDEEQNSRFPEKVLKYLWDDAFKFTKEDIFDLDKVQSLEEVIEMFVSSTKNDRLKVFKENIYNTLVKKNNENA